MRRFNIRLLLTLCVLAFGSNAMAQYLRSGYFLDGMTYRHQINPAFMGESNYVNMPLFVLGNFNVGLQGNIGVNDFLYKYGQNGYPLTTFMNPMVDRDEFLNNLHDMNHLNMNLNMPIISFGFQKWGGFNTFGVNLRTDAHVNLPYGLFDFMKTGMIGEGSSHYEVDDLTVRANSYVEVALGHAREVIEDRLTVGAKVKFLLGAANVDARIDNMDITMGQDQWLIKADGYVDGSLKGAYFTHKEPEEGDTRRDEVDGIEVESPGLGGFGLAFDFGAEYKMDDFVEGLSLSASLTDLGFIRWNNGISARMGSEYTFNGFEHPVVIDPDENNPADQLGDIDNQIEQIGDDLEEFIKLYDDGAKTSRTTKLAATMNIGAEYEFPFYRKLTFGFLSSTYFNKPFTWTEARFSANVSPVKWFEAAVTYGVGTFGSSLGWVLNFHPNGFNVFIASDCMITKVTPQYVPVGNANMNLNIGFNITWGKNKYAKAHAKAHDTAIAHY